MDFGDIWALAEIRHDDEVAANATNFFAWITNEGNKALDIAISREAKEDLLRHLYDALVRGTSFALDQDRELKTITDLIWKGEDKDRFIENFNKTKAETKKRIEEHYQVLKRTLDNVDAQWEEFRATNVTNR